MPQTIETLLLNRPTSSNTALPTQGPTTWLDPVLQGVDTALGLEKQRPGSMAGAIGAATGALFPSIAKVLQFRKPVQAAQNLDELAQAVKASPRMAEFQPMPDAGTLNELSPEEMNKVIDLSKPRPWLERK